MELLIYLIYVYLIYVSMYHPGCISLGPTLRYGP